MLSKIKELVLLIVGSGLLVQGSRTYVRVPLWLAVLAALWSPKLLLVTVVLVVALGMDVHIVKA